MIASFRYSPSDFCGAFLSQIPDEENGLAQELIAQWPAGTPFDALRVLAERPEQWQDQSLVVTLAYEEYCQRREAGEEIDPRAFAARFTEHQAAVMDQLEVHHFLFEDGLEALEQSVVGSPRVGDRFLGFHLIGELGLGNFSHVFLAREISLGDRLVVVKICKGGGCEAHTLGELQHPQIVPVFSVRTDDRSKLTAICMPFLGRATLGRVLRETFSTGRPPTRGKAIAEVISRINGPQSRLKGGREAAVAFAGSYVDAVLRLGVQLADALAYTHQKGIFHRDIKPSNVLLTADGRARLFDFNLAFRHNAKAPDVAGTFDHMAPEQLQGVRDQQVSPSAVGDARTDIFALGVTLYELLSGKLPFESLPRSFSKERVVADLIEQQRCGPPPLRRFNRDVDAKLARLIEQCLSFDADRRPQSAAQLASLLKSHGKPRRRLARWINTHPRTTAATAVAVAAWCIAAAAFVTTRAPYSVRQLQSGWAAQESGRHAAAVACFTAAVESDPNLAEALFARGRSHLQLGEFDLAFQDFRRTAALVDDGRVSACLAHCLANLDRRYQAAIEYYQRAMNQGHSTAAVYNNLAHCYEQIGKIETADALFREAVARDKTLQRAQHGLARLNYRQAVSEGLPLELSHIQHALHLGPGSADLYLDAACIYALAEKRRLSGAADASATDARTVGAGFIRLVLDCCRQAVDQGLEPQRLESVAALLGRLQGDARFVRLRNAPPPQSPPPKMVWFVDPLEGETGTAPLTSSLAKVSSR